MVKEQVKALVRDLGQDTSEEEASLWAKFKQLRNLVNNITRQEEIKYKRGKVRENEKNP